MPRDYGGPRPKPRSAAEVQAVLAGSTKPGNVRPIRVVLVAGKKDHGKGEHDYPAWQTAWAALFRLADRVEVATAWEWPDPAEFGKADVIVFYQHGDWTPARAAAVDAFLERGGGLVYIHWAVDGRGDAPGFAKRIGLAAPGGNIRYRHGPLDLAFNPAINHPVARNFDRLKLVDESYWMLTGDLPKDRVIATQVEDGEPRPLFWSVEHGPRAGVRVDPGPLLVDVRRPAVSGALAPRHRLGGEGAGGPVQRPRLAGGGFREVKTVMAGRGVADSDLGIPRIKPAPAANTTKPAARSGCFGMASRSTQIAYGAISDRAYCGCRWPPFPPWHFPLSRGRSVREGSIERSILNSAARVVDGRASAEPLPRPLPEAGRGARHALLPAGDRLGQRRARSSPPLRFGEGAGGRGCFDDPTPNPGSEQDISPPPRFGEGAGGRGCSPHARPQHRHRPTGRPGQGTAGQRTPPDE